MNTRRCLQEKKPFLTPRSEPSGAAAQGPRSDLALVLCLQRPYEIHSATPVDEIISMFKVERVHYSSTWCKGMVALLKKVREGSPMWSPRADTGVPAGGGVQTQWHDPGADNSQLGSKARAQATP